MLLLLLFIIIFATEKRDFVKKKSFLNGEDRKINYNFLTYSDKCVSNNKYFTIETIS